MRSYVLRSNHVLSSETFLRVFLPKIWLDTEHMIYAKTAAFIQDTFESFITTCNIKLHLPLWQLNRNTYPCVYKNKYSL
jgi:hypothetical protein